MNLLLQSSPHFAVLREYLRAAGYNDEAICARLKIPELPILLTRQRKAMAPLKDNDELALLIRLLLMGDSLDQMELQAVIPANVLVALSELGLLVAAVGESQVVSSAVLYPFAGLLIISDRWFTPDGKDYKAPDDIVYPAITPNTTEFLASLPTSHCENFLELCSGTGAVALATAAYADRAWAIDITQRSTQMAEFNRLLNGIDNATVMQGDLYAGVEGIRFDRIVAHPPYMPVLSKAQIFYDGGADGEQITRRCIEGLPHYLKPGGSFYCQAQGSDRKDAPLEQRIRIWLGASHAEFDVAVVEKRPQAPKDAAFIYALKSRGGFESVELMLESLARLGVESMAYGWIVVQRRSEPRNVFTVRRASGQRTGAAELAWLMSWETFAAVSAPSYESLLDLRPTARSALELRTLYKLKNGDLAPQQFTLHADDPFSMDCKVQPWVAYLIPLCDGTRTVRELFAACKANRLIHLETPEQEFLELIAVLISGGFVEVGEFQLTTSANGVATTAELQNQPL